MNIRRPAGLVTILMLFSEIFFHGSAFAQPVRVTVKTVDGDTGWTVPCRIRLEDEHGEFTVPPGVYNYRNWFPIDGEVELTLNEGRYKVEAARGLEWHATERQIFAMTDGQRETLRLKRWIDMNEEGWRSGDMHVHRPFDVIESLLEAEDLNIAPVLSLWNGSSMFEERGRPPADVFRAGRERYYSVMNAEHERQGGAVMVFNLREPVDVARYGAWHPDAVSLMREARGQGAFVEIEKPFWIDYPLWLALGGPHSVGVVCNHFMEEQVMNNSAWGRPRDEGYPEEPVGLALYVMDLYYKALNCGYRLTATAGSASGVLDNPVGQNRTYVDVGRRFTYERWFERLRDGKNFATNGPILLAEVDHKGPGSDLRPDREFEAVIHARSKTGVTKLEWIADGEVAASYEFSEPRTEVRIADTLANRDWNWLAARAFEAAPEAIVRFAHTSPFYINNGAPMKPKPADVQFFIEWLDWRIEQTRDPEPIPDDAARAERIANLERAREVFAAMLENES